MPTLANGSGALRINVPRGSTLIIRNQSGVETVTGSSAAREDATFALGANAVVYGPQSASSDVSITTTGVLTYDIVSGDATPATDDVRVSRNAATGAPGGLVDANNQPVGGGGVGIYYPPTDDAAGIALAAYQARLDGGGIVQLKPITYNIPAGVTFSTAKVIYQGMLPAGIAGDDPIYVSGTRFLGPGSGICFGDNTVDRATPYATNELLVRAAINGGGIQDMFIENFDYGVKIGAFQEAGPAYMRFKRLHVRNNKKWGMWLENYSHIEVDTVVPYNNGHGVALVTSTPGYNFGNSIITSIIGGNNVSGGSGMGFFVYSYNNAQTNAVQMYNIQVGGNMLGTSTQSTQFVPGSLNIGVTDLSKFEIGMPVTFNSGSNGFFAARAYFVVAVSGTAGAGTIQVSATYAGPAITVSGGSTITVPANINVRGHAAVVVAGAPGSFITYCSITGASDIELSGVVRVHLQNIKGGTFQFGIISNGPEPAICMRGVNKDASIHLGQSCVIDADEPYNHMGSLAAFTQQGPGCGITLQTDFRGQIYMFGSTPYLRVRGDSFDRMQVLKFFGDHEQIVNGGTLTGRNANNLTFITDTPGSSFTLQASTSTNMPAMEFTIFNATANAVTMNYNATSGTQIIVPGSGPANSYSIPAWSSIVIKLIQKGSTLYWAVLA